MASRPHAGSGPDAVVVVDTATISKLGTEAGHLIGRKALGLLGVPKYWRPPFAVLTSAAFDRWRAANRQARTPLLPQFAREIASTCKQWEATWTAGIILRSSSSEETLHQRGAYASQKLPADYSSADIERAISTIFSQFDETGAAGTLGIILQPLVADRWRGHISNERRVSKTINQWACELEGPQRGAWRFNSQRSRGPTPSEELLALSTTATKRTLQSVGRWANELARGPAHIEWCWDGHRVWILQIDFEDEMPDDGVDPAALLRTADTRSSPPLRKGSVLRRAAFGRSGWPKVDNAAVFARARRDPFPQLYTITGDRLPRSKDGLRQLAVDIAHVTFGRAVCRTDCKSKKTRSVNLPRTDSVSGAGAVRFMQRTVRKLRQAGTGTKEICFIIHRFIPAQAAAWSLVAPNKPLVMIDSLWGVPDGLQYLAHDSFEYDVRRRSLSAERTRFKPVYIQETSDGSWKEIRVKRSLARRRSLMLSDIADIAITSTAIARKLRRPIQIMWFCGIPETIGIGRNLPWFLMDADYSKPKSVRIAPGLKRLEIRTVQDVLELQSRSTAGCLLSLSPSVELIRDHDKFLERIIDFAVDRELPVELRGSALGHAFYTLNRAHVTVVPADTSGHQRVRGKQTFRKLVRDQVPARIAAGGEHVHLASIAKHEARAALSIKLLEELHELKEAREPQDVKAELADLLEVVKSLSSATGVPWSDVQAMADEKRRSRGSFAHGTVLLETSWPRAAEANSSQESELIPLHELGHTIALPNGVELTYPAVLAPGAEAIARLPSGLRVRLSLTKSGIRVEEVADEVQSASQLTLPFES